MKKLSYQQTKDLIEKYGYQLKRGGVYYEHGWQIWDNKHDVWEGPNLYEAQRHAQLWLQYNPINK